jgi:hypothetical protein
MGKKQPDLAAAAREQGAMNKETAIAEWQLNNSDQTGPFGSRKTVQVGTYPDGTPKYEIQTTLDPQDQANLTAERQIGSDLLKLAPTAINNAWSTVGKAPEIGNLPPMTSQVDTGGMEKLDLSGLPQSQYTAGKGEIQKNLDFSGLQPLDDASAVRNSVESAMFNKFYDRFAPAAQQQQNALNTRIANMGGVSSSDAARRMMGGLLTNQGDQFRQGVFDSIIKAGDAAQQQFGMNLAGRQQGVSEIKDQGNFWNDAQNQDFTQNMANANLWNSSKASDAALLAQQNQMNNQTTQADITNAFNNANLTNASRAQGLSEMTALRQMPLNELMAMLSGSQVNMPQFQMATPTTIAPPPIFQAASQSAQMKNDTFNSMLSGASKIGAAAVSDARLKENLTRVGTTPAGVPVYDYNLLWSDERETGVMAQDLLETQPDAVSVGEDGFYRVDYSKVQ